MFLLVIIDLLMSYSYKKEQGSALISYALLLVCCCTLTIASINELVQDPEDGIAAKLCTAAGTLSVSDEMGLKPQEIYYFYNDSCQHFPKNICKWLDDMGNSCDPLD